MNDTRVVIINTGIANTASVSAAFERLGCTVLLTEDPDIARDAKLLVLPGVGSFGSGMEALRQSGLDSVLVDRVRQNRPLLGICLGMQMLCSASEESPGVRGLGVIDAMVTRFPGSVRSPQHGWNTVKPLEGFNGMDAGYAYYSNSFRVESCPDGWASAATSHGDAFVSALQRGPILVCQFHPELSGKWGTSLLQAWIVIAQEVAAC